jgi:tetratricopeptide (TPR) repeat protein
MANSALIDDLLKQFAENPRRVFARLANEYRKRGELDSAIEICRSHVPLQPGYISGHIVLGQALYESGSLEEARSAFETALALDPENLIALRHMGDIARSTGGTESARGWYRQLLEIDPQNEEVAAQLESLGAHSATPDSAPEADAEAMRGWGDVNPEAVDLAMESDALSGSDVESGGETEVALEGAAQESAAVESAVPEAEATAASTDDALALDEIFDFPESAEREEAASEDAAEEPPIATIEGLEATSFESDESQSDDRAESTPLVLLELEEHSSEAPDVAENDAEAPEPAPSASAVAPLFAAETYDFSDDSSSDDEDTVSAFTTETMAELYLQQGLPDRALAIYRELAERNPADDSLRERIAELTEPEEAAPAPVASESRVRTAREFFGVLAYRHPPHVVGHDSEPEPAAAPAAESDGDDRDLLADVHDMQPVASATTPEPSVLEAADPAVVEARNGKPGREAASALSLDDVFRDAAAGDASGSRKGLSFDEFFAKRGNGAAEQTAGAVAAEADENSPADDHSSDDEPQDLQLFHAWLDGLKG